MLQPFILRFAEPIHASPTSLPIQAGTKTVTEVRSEAVDHDPRQAGYTAISRGMGVQAGTITSTRVENEQGDKDRASDSHAVPRHRLEMGTKTVTAVRAEADDNDPGRLQNQIVPRCS